MDKIEQLEAIQEIKDLMNKSVKFLSLSGLSGFFAGIYAIGAALVIIGYNKSIILSRTYGFKEIVFNVGTAIVCLILSILTAFMLTKKKARQTNTKLWDASAKNAFFSLLIPLIAGGVFCLSLLFNGFVGYIAPSCLVFYGLSLVNASKYTFSSIRYLGYIELLLGLFNAFFIGFGLIFWILGFGIMHIIYGVYMYYKYDRK